MTKYLLVYFLVIISLLDITLQNESKSRLIEKIREKIAQAIKHEKNMSLDRIKRRVSLLAASHGLKSKKYVDLIMEGIRITKNKKNRRRHLSSDIIANRTLLDIIHAAPDEFNDFKNVDVLIPNNIVKKQLAPNISLPCHYSLEGNTNDNVTTNLTITETDLIQDIAKKFEIYSQLFNVTNSEQSVLDNFKKHMFDTVMNDTNMSNATLDLYNNVIARGVQMAKNKNSGAIDEYDIHRMQWFNETLKLDMVEKKPKLYAFDAVEKNSCSDFVDTVCPRISSLKVVQCNSNKTLISVETLCDGYFNCPDGSDEWNCTGYVLDKVNLANHLLIEIGDSPSECHHLQDHVLLAQQNQLFRDVLQNQLDIINKHKIAVFATIPNPKDEVWKKVKKAGHQLANVVNALSDTYSNKVCNNNTLEDDENRNELRKYNDYDILPVEVHETTTWAPSSCACQGQYCLHKNCKKECHQICRETYHVGRWQCGSLTDSGDINSVSLDMICDGKHDCYDETDEDGCSSGVGYFKFEANSMFDLISKVLVAKSLKVPYEVVKNKLLKTKQMVLQLQKACVANNPDIAEVKRLRNKCVTFIEAVYKATLFYSPSTEEVHNMYKFLKTVFEKLISALKRSHTGNDKVALHDGCYCKSGKCAVSDCTRTCIRACAAEPKLTRYFCDNHLSYENSVPVSAVCDGKKDCLGGDDEEDCSKDVCCQYHLMVLRGNIRKVGFELKGSLLGEVLRDWRNQVIGTLLAAEEDTRPTPATIKHIVNDMLHNLLLLYSSFPESKSNDEDNILYQFFKASREITKALKSCGY